MKPSIWRMSTLSPAGPSLSIVDLASLLFLGAVWGAAFLFYRIASPEVGPARAAEIRLLLGASVCCWSPDGAR